jgi:hypothetical protein
MEHLIIWALFAVLAFMFLGAIYGAGSFLTAVLRSPFRKTPRD